MTSALRAPFDLPATARPTVGDIKMSIVDVDHIGWLRCDGRALSTDEYRTLFAVLGYRFGGSGDTFNLPNPQGRVLGCAGTSTGNTWSIGDASGNETHTLTTDELPPHNHDADGTAPPGGPGNTTYSATDISNNTAGTHAHTGVTDPAGTHAHTASSAADGIHSHTSNATGGQGNYGLALANGANTVIDTDSSTGELNVWTLPGALTINNSTSHTHAITVNATPDHTHTFLSDTSGAHTHAITDPTHRHQIASVGNGDSFSLLQPTLFIANVFMYGGRPFHRITLADGVTVPSTYPNVFPLDPDYEVF